MPERVPKAAQPDAVLAKAVDLARESLAPIAHAEHVGEHLQVTADGQRLASHYFECLKPGYRGWRWVSTLARAPRARTATVCEIDLVPGPDSLLAPPWVPWEQRLAAEERERDAQPGAQADPAPAPAAGPDRARPSTAGKTADQSGVDRAD